MFLNHPCQITSQELFAHIDKIKISDNELEAELSGLRKTNDPDNGTLREEEREGGEKEEKEVEV